MTNSSTVSWTPPTRAYSFDYVSVGTNLLELVQDEVESVSHRGPSATPTRGRRRSVCSPTWQSNREALASFRPRTTTGDRSDSDGYRGGTIEMGAIVLLLVGVGERLAALSLIPVVLVAILYVGPDWKNLSVLIWSLAILTLEADPDSFGWRAGQRLG